MSKQSINTYYNKIEQYKQFGGTRNETSIRRAFANLLESYCTPKNLALIDELKLKNSNKRPDGTVKDALEMTWGHWESKDPKDDLDKEIEHKLGIGYPSFNIIFENSEQIVLFQEQKELMRGDMQDAKFLHRLLSQFISYERPEITEFRQAINKFKEDIPEIVEALRKMIEKESKNNAKFIAARANFWELCKESINPQISAFDIREMLIQHILTAEIFDTVFGDSHFHRENNIARELEAVINTFFVGAVRRNTLSKVDNYYKTIKREAANIDNHHEKQKFLKVIYETFYKAYNPKGADRLGVVYTPNEIVKFMIESADYLLEKHFNKNLADKNVQILDPATGTGTFITDIIEYIPPQYLKHKFKNEIHCNELAILPYYIANLNIEYTYQQKMGEYEPFENIVFVDTLDNLGFDFVGKQNKMFAMTSENLERIKNQNSKEISVIIGNPPYNSNQMDENQNNKNREYFENTTKRTGGIDGRIKDTYVKYSTAQKSKVYDMYARFYRWASDRIDKNGVIAFVTNRSFIESRTFDGFRKSVADEFDYIYVVDLNGDIRSKKEQAGGNVFGILTGVAIAFFVKKEEFDLNDKKLAKQKARIRYTSLFKEGAAKEKLEFLASTALKRIPFDKVIPDKNNNWINIADNDFKDNVLLISKRNKENSIFKVYSNGISTNRDEWVYDLDKQNLLKKSRYFTKIYNSELKRWIKFKKETNYTDIKAESNRVVDDFVHAQNLIKWSARIKRDKLRKGKRDKFNKNNLVTCQYRPYSSKFLYYSYIAIDLKGKFNAFFPTKETENKLIVLDNSGRNFHILTSDRIVDLHYTGDSVCLPIYHYDQNGTRIDNITDWGLKQFQNHYQNKTITKTDIFHYTYAVLHNPAYRKKYELNLKREFPRLPFYENFEKWVSWGKELIDLHINYESVKPYKLKMIENKNTKENPKAKLHRDKDTNEIILDENTSITGIPKIAFEYKLGNRSAIDWILDQHKEKTPRDKTIAEKFNTYKFSDYKDKVIDLIMRVTTVSVETMEIVTQMESQSGLQGTPL